MFLLKAPSYLTLLLMHSFLVRDEMVPPALRQIAGPTADKHWVVLSRLCKRLRRQRCCEWTDRLLRGKYTGLPTVVNGGEEVGEGASA